MKNKAVKVEGHNKLPLPLEDEGISQHNHRPGAMKWLDSLKIQSEKHGDSTKNTRSLLKS